MTRAFAEHAATGLPITVSFDRSRASGGLDRSGRLHGASPPAEVGTIIVIGKFAP